MKAFAYKPPSRGQKLGRELLHGMLAIGIGAALAYAGVHLYNLLYPPVETLEISVPPEPARPTVAAASLPLPAGEDPWWRGDALFWQEQARLNSAAVAPQYRDLQVAWAQMMAASAEQRSAQGPAGDAPLAVQAKEARTTELQIPAATRN